MGIIQRPVKQFGARTYSANFALAPLNPTPPPTNLYEIQTAEVDGDLDTIYFLVNGQLDNSNIVAGAGIVYSKLNLTDSIVDADINSAAAIKGSKLADAPDGITTTKINDLAVTREKLAVGAAIQVNGSLLVSANAGVVVAGVEVDIVNFLPAITTRGGTVLIGGTVAWLMSEPDGGGGSVFRIRLYRDATVILDYDVSIGTIPVLTGNALVMPVPTPQYTDFFVVAGAHTYRLTAQRTSGTGSLQTPGARPGAMSLVELS